MRRIKQITKLDVTMPLFMNIHIESFINSKKIHSTNKMVGGVDFFAVQEHAFYGPLWTKSLAKSLFFSFVNSCMALFLNWRSFPVDEYTQIR